MASAGIPSALVWYVGGHRWALTGAAALVLGAPLLRIVFTYRDPRALNRVLAGTGLMLLIFSLLFSAGWLI